MDDKNRGNSNIEDWEKELQDKLGTHRVETDTQDLDLFLNKLDSNDFFKPKYKVPSGTWAFVAGMVVVSLGIFVLYDDEPAIKIQESTPVIEPKSIETTDKEGEKAFSTVDSNSTEVVEEVKDSTIEKPLVEALEAPKVNVEADVVEEIQNTKQNSDRQHNEAKKSTSKEVVEPVPSEKEQKDEVKKEAKDVPVARKRIVIMSTDTTVVSDTTHVKHRKKDHRIKE